MRLPNGPLPAAQRARAVRAWILNYSQVATEGGEERYLDDQFENGNGPDVLAEVCQLLREDREFARAATSYRCRQYMSPEMLSAANENGGTKNA